MIEKQIYKDIEYHLSSRNLKALFTGKTEHLRHYDPHIVKLQNNVGLNKYENKRTFKLPKPSYLNMSLSEAMQKRRSRRDYTDYKITLKEISTLLYYSCGYKRETDIQRKHVPSSGGFNSTEIYAIVLNAEELPLGIYYFNAREFSLKQIKEGDYREWIRNDAFYQNEWADASIIFILASDFIRLYQKYLHRAYRLCLLDVGHAAQNLYLTCAAMNMKICEVLGYVENEVENALELDGINVLTFSSLIIGK